MRWLFWAVFIVLALGAAAFGVGYYTLPPVLEVSRAVVIARPASVIYPLLTDLRSFNEFSPWFERDPKAEYVFEGPVSGVGQTAAWSSSVREIGSGQITIVKTIENKEVDTRIELGGGPIPFVPPPHILSKFLLTAEAGGTRVAWTTRTTCPSRPTAVPCRIMAKLSQLQLGDAFGQGLNKLKKVSEALPAVDIAALKIEHVGFEARPFAYKVTPFPNTPEEFRAALRDTFVLKEQLAKAGASNAGAAMAILVRDRSGKAQLYAGVIFEGAAPDALPDGVALARTPGGPTLKVVYVGPYAGMRAVYAQLDAYVRAHRQQVLGEPWELYLDDPDKVDPSQARTEIYVPVK